MRTLTRRWLFVLESIAVEVLYRLTVFLAFVMNPDSVFSSCSTFLMKFSQKVKIMHSEDHIGVSAVLVCPSIFRTCFVACGLHQLGILQRQLIFLFLSVLFFSSLLPVVVLTLRMCRLLPEMHNRISLLFRIAAFLIAVCKFCLL